MKRVWPREGTYKRSMLVHAPAKRLILEGLGRPLRLIAYLCLIMVLVGMLCGCAVVTNTSNQIMGSRFTTTASLMQTEESSSLVLAQRVAGSMDGVHLLHYTPFARKGGPLVAQTLHAPQFAGIAPDRKSLLYQVPDANQMNYYVVRTSQAEGTLFYHSDTQSAGNALWLPDSRHVLILSRGVGVLQVDTQGGETQTRLLLPSGKKGQQLDIARLIFYRAGYLYFIGGAGACEDLLCRVQLKTALVQQVSFRTPDAHYWLSPDGSTIFFANTQGSPRRPGIYAVNADGSHLRLLRPYPNALPIGSTQDAAPVMLRKVSGTFQLVKIGATPRADRVVLSDVAPGAISLCPFSVTPAMPALCDSSIALAPSGRTLVVQATFADGSSKLLALDIPSGRRNTLQFGIGEHVNSPVQLLGWLRSPPS